MKTKSRAGAVSSIPPKVRDLVRASREAMILNAAAAHEIFDAIRPRGSSASEVSRAKRLSPRAVELVLNALVAEGFLKKRAGVYFNSPIAKKYLVTSSPASIIGSLQHGNNVTKRWARLDEALKSGPIRETPKWERGKAVRETAVFARAMFVNARDAAAALPEMVDPRDCRSLIDIGGGVGHFSFFLCKKYPRLTATVFDFPATLREARKYFKMYRMGGRLRAAPGDFTKTELPRSFDAALVSQIIHSYGEKENLALFRKVYRCLNPGGIFILRNFLLNPDRTSPSNAAVFAINMLVNTRRGRTYSFDEVTGWMRKAGFRKIRRVGRPAFGDASVMTAEK